MKKNHPWNTKAACAPAPKDWGRALHLDIEPTPVDRYIAADPARRLNIGLTLLSTSGEGEEQS